MKHAPFEVERQLCLAAFAMLTQPKHHIEHLDEPQDCPTCGGFRPSADDPCEVLDQQYGWIVCPSCRGTGEAVAPDASAEAKHANALLSEMEDV